MLNKTWKVLHKMTTALPQKIILKSATNMSDNDSFSQWN